LDKLASLPLQPGVKIIGPENSFPCPGEDIRRGPKSVLLMKEIVFVS
jgi:hypothetical protein